MARTRKKRPVVKLNSAFEPIGYVSFNDAISDIVLGKVWSYAPDKDFCAQGPLKPDGTRLSIPWPTMVIQKKTVAIDWDKVAPVDTILASRMAILNRDLFQCQYCGDSASTIDHVYPQWRGGENTWLNLVAACIKCNTAKAGLTLEEMTKMTTDELMDVGLEKPLKLRREPFVPKQDKFAKVRKEVYRLLEEGALDDIEEF